MPIDVVCPHCHARFRVSDQFAGKRGPCPKCKGEIRVPEKSEEVVIHAPETQGPKGVSGRAVLKPLSRKESKFSWPIAGAIGGAVALLFIAAFIVRLATDAQPPLWLLAIGAFIVAPPLAFGGYTFLRDQEELEPYRGVKLWIRVLICSAVYAVLWGAHTLITGFLLGDDPIQMWHMLFILPPLILAGGVAALATLDLEYMNACMHYGMYLVVTILLRLIVGLGPL